MPLINLAIFLAAAAAISYEILGASVLVNLLGSSIYYFSLTIGIFLAALGVGAWLSSKIEKNLVEKLIFIETILAFLGGGLAVLIYGGYVAVFELLRELAFYNVMSFVFSLGIAQIVFGFLAFFFIFIIGVLIGFELPLFSRISAQNTVLKNALGRVFFWDYAGSLIASVALPIVFFVSLGLIKTSFLMGAVNVAAAFMLILILRSGGERVKPVLLYGLILVLFINILGIFSANRLELFFEKKQYGDREILYHNQSVYQRFSFVKANDGKISLYINGNKQFESGQWEKNYHKTFVNPAFTVKCGALSAECKNLNVLILGGGDGLALREILKYNFVSDITLVDIDSAIVKASSELDFMKVLNNNAFDDPRAKVVIDDAFKFVEKNYGKGKYDFIFVDFPDPTDDNLARLYSKEFYLTLKNILNPDGLVVIQSGAYAGAAHKTIILTLESGGFKALPFHSIYFDFLEQNFGFTFASLKDFSIPKELNVIIAPVPIPNEQSSISVNSIFKPSIMKFQNGGFAQQYLNSRPIEEILAQIKIPQKEIYNQFQKILRATEQRI